MVVEQNPGSEHWVHTIHSLRTNHQRVVSLVKLPNSPNTPDSLHYQKRRAKFSLRNSDPDPELATDTRR